MDKVIKYLNNKGYKTKKLGNNSIMVDVHYDTELAEDLVYFLKHNFQNIKCYTNDLVDDEPFVVIEK